MWLSKISFRSWLWLVLMLPLAFAARYQNRSNIFVEGKVFFVDGDCYSRMTRVKTLLDHPLSPIHHHDFENYPQGVKAHTTAPMDYLIALLALALKPFTSLSLDLAGAFIAPLLGCATLLFLWFWANQMQFRHGPPMLLLFALSPILVHGTALGRPDHQSLLILLLAIAIGSEWALIRTDSPSWQIASGLAWGTSLWVSFYEPLLLLLAVGVGHFLFSRKSLFHSERWYWLAAFALPILLMLLIEGAPFAVPDSSSMHAFSQWTKSIGELASLPPFSPILFRWTGLFLFAAPLLLFRKHRGPLFLLVLVYGLTLWQMRWGYFLALVFAMTFPWQLENITKRWLIWALFPLSLWPILREWDERLFPNEIRSEQLATDRMETLLLRDIAEQLRSPEKRPILAPWWMCPPLAYWSGQPCVAGSSHESLPGIIDTARFYTSPFYFDRDARGDSARKILKDRGVKLILVCEPSRVLETARPLISQGAPDQDSSPQPSPADQRMIEAMYAHPHTLPSFLQLQLSNPLYKIFSVDLPK